MINQNLYNSIKTYFDVLSKTGNFKEGNTYKLVLLSFISDVLESNCDTLIGEEDYNKLLTLYSEISNSNCLFDYPTFRTKIESNKVDINRVFRITEEGILRFTQSDLLRTML